MHLHHNFFTNIPVYVLQDPAMSGMISNLTNPAHKEQLEQRMAQVHEDPALKPVLEEIESGGPAAMMKWMTLLLKSTDFLSLCFCCILDIFVAIHALPDCIKSLLSKVLGCKQCSIYSFHFITYWFLFLSFPSLLLCLFLFHLCSFSSFTSFWWKRQLCRVWCLKFLWAFNLFQWGVSSSFRFFFLH